MLKRLFFVGLLTIGSLSTASASPYWVNIVMGDASMSIPVTTDSRCTEAVMRYAQSSVGGYISCDVKPLPDGVDLLGD